MNANVLVMKKNRFPFFSERKTSREYSKLTFSQTYVLSLLLIGFLGIYYVWTLNVNATKGYNVRNLEITRHDLTVQENLLNIRIAEAESLSSINSNPNTALMQSIDAPQYLKIKESYVSFKQ